MEAYEQLEKEFGEWIGNPNTVACASGTAALHLALEVAQVAGGPVLVPQYTMIACPRAVTMARATPLLVDCCRDLLLDMRQVELLSLPGAAAIMPVHIYGRRCHMDLLHDYLDNGGLDNYGGPPAVIEDMAEIHGVNPDSRSFAACWSFYKNKIIAGEEGGMIAFRDDEAVDVAKSLRSHGFTPEHDFRHTPFGVNARLSNAHAKLILESFHARDENIAKRRQVEQWYNEQIPSQYHMPRRDACWVYDLKIPMSYKQQDDLVHRLQVEAGCSARHGFKPIGMQPEYLMDCRYTVASRLAKQIICLPIRPEMTEDDVVRIADVFKAIIQSRTWLHLSLD